jgi:hypothetical protein
MEDSILKGTRLPALKKSMVSRSLFWPGFETA